MERVTLNRRDRKARQALMVRGGIHYTTWTDSDDIKRYGTEITADEVSFLARDRQASERPGNGNDTTETDDIPF